jgi:Cof subfamily protein (haloacid dehalogenase superfamily)
MIKLFVSDLDGTLFHNPGEPENHGISTANRNALKRLREQNVRFMMATGRDHWFREILQADIGFQIDAIGLNGCNVVIDNEVICDHGLAYQDVLDIMNVVEDAPVEVNMLGINSAGQHVFQYVDREPFDYFYQLHLKGVFKHMSTEPLHRWLSDANNPAFNKMVGLTKNEGDRDRMVAFFHQRFNGRFDVFYSGPLSMELMPDGVSKGSALLELMRIKGYGLDEVAVIGDSMNDIQMLQAVPHSFVMNHAEPAIQQHARTVVASVAEAIEQVLKHNERTV